MQVTKKTLFLSRLLPEQIPMEIPGRGPKEHFSCHPVVDVIQHLMDRHHTIVQQVNQHQKRQIPDGVGKPFWPAGYDYLTEGIDGRDVFPGRQKKIGQVGPDNFVPVEQVHLLLGRVNKYQILIKKMDIVFIPRPERYPGRLLGYSPGRAVPVDPFLAGALRSFVLPIILNLINSITSLTAFGSM